MSPARAAAFRILSRVEAGAWASELLRASSLDSRDAALASEIVFGVLRLQKQLDFLIRCYSGRDPGRLDPEVLRALRTGIYQLRYLERVPRHAAVSESVELVKRARKASAAGFVNAVLRKVGREPVTWPDRATELSIPGWILARWDRQYGIEAAAGVARAFLAPPAKYIRGVPPEGLTVEAAEIPGCYRVIGGNTGGLRLHDIGSQSIVPLLDLESGQSFLDLCAAPGNKTAQALESGVDAIACDLHLSRLRMLDWLPCRRAVLDAARPLPFSRKFDRILLDVPCSGTGTIGRNPEIKWRIQETDIQSVGELQKRLLSNALRYLAPGGRLVYSTCSLEREENEEVVATVIGRLPSRIERRLPGIDAGDGFFAAVIRFEESPIGPDESANG